MTILRASIISFFLGCIVMLFLAYKFMPDPKPIIVEKIVEVESKKTAKKTVTNFFPGGGIASISEDEITDYLKNYNKDQKVGFTFYRHQTDLYFNKQEVKAASYKYNFTQRFNAGILYKDELLGSVGWAF